MIRVDLHNHINTDPQDGNFVTHGWKELIDNAVRVGLDAIAITPHDVPFRIEEQYDAFQYAADRDILLIGGVEATVDGSHMLLLNFSSYPTSPTKWQEVQKAKKASLHPTLVVAPHAFYPGSIALGKKMYSRHIEDLVDAIEYSSFYTSYWNKYNGLAEWYAKMMEKPVVGNTDCHFLWQQGKTYTEVDLGAAHPTPGRIFGEVKAFRCRVVSKPCSPWELIKFLMRAR